MLQLLTDLEATGARVYLYMHTPSQLLGSYVLTQLSYNKITYAWYYCKSLLGINQAKWKVRVREYYGTANEPETALLLRKKLKESLRFLCTVQPDLLICWNPYSAAHGLLGVAAQQMGIPVGGMDWGLLPQTFIVDPKGTLASSLVFNRRIAYTNAEELLRAGNQVYTGLKDTSISLYAQASKPLPEVLQITNPAKTRILLIGIDELDSGAIPDTDPDRRGLLPFHESNKAAGLAFAAADSDFQVIIKPHPSHNYLKDDRQLAENCWVLNINPEELITWADVVVCSGSKMEISVLLKNKPLVNVGAGLLYNKGCTYEVHQPGELREVVQEAKHKGITDKQLRNFKTFLGYLHVHYLYAYTAGAQNQEVIDRLLAACK